MRTNTANETLANARKPSGKKPRKILPYTYYSCCDDSPPPHPSRRNNRVQLFDASTRKLKTVVGRRGQIRPGRMQGPEGVAFVDGRREVGHKNSSRTKPTVKQLPAKKREEELKLLL